MQARGRHSTGQFWWRATEPIPARPEKLAAIDEPDTAEPAAAAAPHAPPHHVRAPFALSFQPPLAARFWSRPSAPVAAAPAAAPRDLGAYRPTSSDLSDVASSPEAVAFGPSSPDVSLDPVKVLARRPPVARPRHMRLHRRHALLAAGVAGAVLFAASTDFGRHVRRMEAFSGGLDDLLVAAGLGINEISLVGHKHTEDQDIFRALGAGRATLLTLDVRAARRRVEALPWVESAAIARIFPDKLRVELKERRPAAVWHDGDRTALVDAEGRVLSYVAASLLPAGLPHIAGAGAPAAAAELRIALSRYPAIASRVVVARRVGDRRWDLELSNKALVKLAADEIPASLERFVRLEEETRWLDQAGQVVDLTVPKTIAVSAPSAAAATVPRAPIRSSSPRPL